MKTLATPLPEHPAVASRKLFYRIQQVSKLTGLKPYVLRYWESEFKELAPAKDASDQRRYRQADIEVILAIRKLLYEDRFTIEGARKRLKDELRSIRGEAADSIIPAKKLRGNPLPIDDFLPAPLRRTARRSLAEATVPRLQQKRRLILRDREPACGVGEVGDLTPDTKQTAAIISIATEDAENSPDNLPADLDAHRLENAMRRLKNEVNGLLEMLS